MSGLVMYAIFSTFFVIIEAVAIVIEIKEIKKIVENNHEILFNKSHQIQYIFSCTASTHDNIDKIVKVVDSLDAKKNFIEGLYFDKEKAINTLAEIPHEYMVDAESIKKQMEKEEKDDI